jgi:hypothetical protein
VKFMTRSGTRYEWSPPILMRLSEVPAGDWPPRSECELVAPIEVGVPARFRSGLGRLTTTRVVEVSG